VRVVRLSDSAAVRDGSGSRDLGHVEVAGLSCNPAEEGFLNVLGVAAGQVGREKTVIEAVQWNKPHDKFARFSESRTHTWALPDIASPE
jgi:hypothetical protein